MADTQRLAAEHYHNPRTRRLRQQSPLRRYLTENMSLGDTQAIIVHIQLQS